MLFCQPQWFLPLYLSFFICAMGLRALNCIVGRIHSLSYSDQLYQLMRSVYFAYLHTVYLKVIYKYEVLIKLLISNMFIRLSYLTLGLQWLAKDLTFIKCLLSDSMNNLLLFLSEKILFWWEFKLIQFIASSLKNII